jgi:hypothetical protein
VKYIVCLLGSLKVSAVLSDNVFTNIFPDLWASIPTYQRPTRSQNVSDRLLQLDSWGLLEKDFAKLFAKCHCGLITTRRIFRDHVCAVAAAPVIIDLTSDDDAEPSNPVVIDLTGDEGSNDD